MEEKVMIGLKKSFSNRWWMVRLNLSLENVRYSEETTIFIEESKKIMKCKKKG